MDFIVLIIAAALFFAIGRAFLAGRNNASANTSGPIAPDAPSEEKPAQRQAATTVRSDPKQMAEDMRMTQTSRIADAVAILDDLGKASFGYRHYAELTGTSMATGGVVAPYSKREVAYYDIKCFRIERRGGQDVETLVAHETSISPFYFADGSGEEGAEPARVYVDLASFGDNVILVNSTNHIEGPGSDFSKAVGDVQAHAAGSAGGTSGTAMAIVGSLARRGAAVFWGLGYALARSLGDAARQAGELLLPVPLGPSLPLQGALACAGAGAGATPAFAPLGGDESGLTSGGRARRSISFALDSRGYRGGADPGGGPRPGGPGPGKAGHGRAGGPRRPGDTAGHGGSGFRVSFDPSGLGDFLGGMGSFGAPFSMGGHPMNVPPRPYGNRDTSGAEILLGMSLGALLSSLNNQDSSKATGGGEDQFRGYRLVEDVVPLSSPIYCIGEVYRNGSDVYIGRSVDKNYTTSFFATRPEAEVVSSLG